MQKGFCTQHFQIIEKFQTFEDQNYRIKEVRQKKEYVYVEFKLY